MSWSVSSSLFSSPNRSAEVPVEVPAPGAKKFFQVNGALAQVGERADGVQTPSRFTIFNISYIIKHHVMRVTDESHIAVGADLRNLVEHDERPNLHDKLP